MRPVMPASTVRIPTVLLERQSTPAEPGLKKSTPPRTRLVGRWEWPKTMAIHPGELAGHRPRTPVGEPHRE